MGGVSRRGLVVVLHVERKGLDGGPPLVSGPESYPFDVRPLRDERD